MRHAARRAALLGRALLCTTALGAALANPAAAQTLETGAQCYDGSINEGKLSIETTTPERWNRIAPPGSIEWKVELSSGRPDAGPAVSTAERVAWLLVAAVQPDGQERTFDVRVPVTLSSTGDLPIPAAHEIAGEVRVPAPALVQDGTTRFEVRGLILSTARTTAPGRNFDGSPLTMPADANGLQGIACRIKPGGDKTLATSSVYASGESPASLTLAATCKHATFDKHPGMLKVSASIPSTWNRNAPPSLIRWKFRYEDGGDVAEILKATWGFVRVNGEAHISIEARGPQGQIAPITVSVALDDWLQVGNDFSGPFVWSGSATTSVPAFVANGQADFVVTGFGHNYRSWTDGMSPVAQKALKTDFDGAPLVDDGDPLTTATSCRIDAGQDRKLATTKVVTGPTSATGGGSLSGALGVPKLFVGTLPLRGKLDLKQSFPSNAVTGSLVLNETVGRLVGGGSQPTTARITLASSGSATGKLVDGELTLQQYVRIKVAEVKRFGSIPIAAGASCQAKEPSLITLKSTSPVFSLAKGGTLEGTFSLSDLNGCPTLAGIIDPKTASTGNTVKLVVAPKATT